MRVVIIGGGAAGMACAIEAASCGHQVTLLERMDRVGKKILATGNGRCNLMNTGTLRYPCGGAFAAEVLALCGVDAQKAFWHKLGLRMREEDGGRVYPASGQASTVLDTLRLALDTHHVTVLTNTSVATVTRSKKGFSVCTADGRSFSCDRVVIAGGGKAQPKLGSDGSTLSLLASLGHTIHPCTPALTALNCDPKSLAGLSGIRVKARVSISCNGRKVHSEAGEVLFTDTGLSGVCIMNCSGYAMPGRGEMHMDLLPSLGLRDAQDASEELHRRRSALDDQPMEQLLTGLCVPRLASALCKKAGIRWKERFCRELTDAELSSLTRTICDFSVPVLSLRGFEQAQVTRGGASCNEFDAHTMQSLLVPGLYAAGEMLDVDGECGGYNLMFAFGSGILAGKSLEVCKA